MQLFVEESFQNHCRRDSSIVLQDLRKAQATGISISTDVKQSIDEGLTRICAAEFLRHDRHL
jgi:hypothetical protein